MNAAAELKLSVVQSGDAQHRPITVFVFANLRLELTATAITGRDAAQTGYDNYARPAAGKATYLIRRAKQHRYGTGERSDPPD